MSRTDRRRTRTAAGVCVLIVLAGTFAAAGNANAQGVRAIAIGSGTVPAGEFAGQRIHAVVIGEYLDIGLTTLEFGVANVRIGTRRFDAIVDPAIPSFCCGEGHVGSDFFSMTGWIRDNAPGGSHAHLFGTSATTDGRMCINIVNQTGSVVPPATPPHNPGIGLICDLPAVVMIVPHGPAALASASLSLVTEPVAVMRLASAPLHGGSRPQSAMPSRGWRLA